MEVNNKQILTLLLIDDNEDEYIIIRHLFAKIENKYEIRYINNYDEGLEEIIKTPLKRCYYHFW